MTKNEVGTYIGRKLGVPKGKAIEAMEDFFDHFAQRVVENGKDSLPGLGTFKMIVSKNRQYRHPKTGQIKVKPVSRRIKFLPRKYLRDRL